MAIEIKQSVGLELKFPLRIENGFGRSFPHPSDILSALQQVDQEFVLDRTRITDINDTDDGEHEVWYLEVAE